MIRVAHVQQALRFTEQIISALCFFGWLASDIGRQVRQGAAGYAIADAGEDREKKNNSYLEVGNEKTICYNRQ